jgi:hypothetical protein
MSMTVLEATVELVKAMVEPGGQSVNGNISTLLNDVHIQHLSMGIEAIYKKLYALERGAAQTPGTR